MKVFALDGPRLWYRRTEVPAVLGMGLRTLDRLIALKEIAVEHVGRSVYITKESLEKFVRRSHQTGGASRREDTDESQ